MPSISNCLKICTIAYRFKDVLRLFSFDEYHRFLMRLYFFEYKQSGILNDDCEKNKTVFEEKFQDSRQTPSQMQHLIYWFVRLWK